MARDTENVTCVRLAFDSNKGLSNRCKKAFWKCCIEVHGQEGNSFWDQHTSINQSKPLFIHEGI